MAFGNIFAQGGCSLISRLLGGRDVLAARHISSFCVYVSFFSGIFIGTGMLIFRTHILSILGTTIDTMEYAKQYYTFLAIGAPFIVTSFIFTNLLRAEGLSREAMTGTISGCIINIILDPIFITLLKMGAGGAAIATVLGYLFSDIYCFIIFAKKSKCLSVMPSEIPITGAFARQIFGIGIPAALTNLMQCISIVFTNQFLLPFGNNQIAAMGIVLKVNSIVQLVLVGLAFGGQPLFGYFYGANDRERLSKLRRFCMFFIGLTAVILTLTVYIASPSILRCFIDDREIIADGTIMLHLQVISAVFVGFILLTTIMSQSAGRVMVSFFLSISRQGIVFLAVLLLAANIAGYYGILASQAIADTITGIAALLILHREKM